MLCVCFLVSGYQGRLIIQEFQGRDEQVLQNYALTSFSQSLANVDLRFTNETASKFTCYFGSDLNPFSKYKTENVPLTGKDLNFKPHLIFLDFIQLKQNEIIEDIKKLKRTKYIDASVILQNIYNTSKNAKDKWTNTENINSDYYESLNEMEDVNLILSKKGGNYYKIK